MLTRRQFLEVAVAGGTALVLPGVGARAAMQAPPRPEPPALPTPDALYDHLALSVRRLTARDPDDLGPIGTRGRAFAWNWSYWGRALVFAYRATGQQRFLDLFAETLVGVLGQRDDRLGLRDETRGRVVAGWGSEVDGRHANEIAVAGLVTLPICEFLVLLRDDPEAMGRYGGLFGDYLASAEEAVWEYEAEYLVTPAGGCYVAPTTFTVEPLNHTHALGAAFVHLSVLTGDPRYSAKIAELARFFRSSATLEINGSWSWPYAWSPDLGQQPPEPVWKAGTTIEFPVAALRHGVAFDTGVEPMSNTLLENVLRPDGINTWVTSRRTSLLGPDVASSRLPGAALAPWFLMPDRTGAIRAALLASIARHPDLFPGGWLDGAKGLSMAAAWLLGSRAGGVMPRSAEQCR